MYTQKYSPTRVHGDVLVVFEGQQRLIWRAPNNGTTGLCSLWPDTAQRQSVGHHLARRAPLLVVIDRDTTPVPLLPEELPALPPEAQPLLDEEDGLPVLQIPLLDWLPESLRQRGAAFMAEADDRLRSTPAALLPDLLPDQETGGTVRFARRATARPLPSCQLGNAIRHLFGRHLGRQGATAGGESPGEGRAALPPRGQSLRQGSPA